MAALVLIVEPGRPRRVDSELLAGMLGLTQLEARVALALAAGQNVGAIARSMGCTNHAIYWHLKQIYQKQPVSRQVDLVRMVLAVTEFD